MRGKKQLRKLKQLLCLLLAVILVCGAVSLESVLAVESETTQETEAQTGETVQEPEAQTEETVQEPETESVEKDSESEETELAAGAETELSTNTEPDKYANRISGVLWIDANEDGTYDSGEQALADYPVCLYLEGDTDNAVETATTDADGKYLFEDITPGSYVVGIKAEENGTEYLLPLVGVQKDNKFYFTPDSSKVISNAVDIDADTVVTDINAAMRTMPQIQPMAGATYTININSPVITGIPGVTYASNILTFTTSVDSTDTYIITGTGAATSNRIIVNSGVTVNITLNGVNISNTVSPFRLLGTANVNLTLSGTNTLTCTGTSTTNGVYQAGLHIDSTATLKIYEGLSGTLNARGGSYGAGIGGSNALGNGGTTMIYGGTVTATGGPYAAGIGGGGYGNGGTIMIYGGTVTATALANGCAGIGGGYNIYGAVGANITISGGMVTATGGGAAAGIGGSAGSGAGNITISGGRVTATSTNSSYPGIGTMNFSGNTSVLGTIVITGGSVLPASPSYGTALYPAPTNGSVNGDDIVSMLTFPQFAGQAFSFIAGGSLQSYPYSGIGHAAAAYPWMPYPGVSTEAATNVTDNSATTNGTYYMNGTTISSAYFEYGTSTGYGNTKTLTTPTNVTSGNIESVSDNLTGLSSNTTHHYRLVITAGLITIPGNDMTFTTKPVVDTLTAAPTGSTTATISGTIALGNASISGVIITYATDAGFTMNVVTINGLSGVTFTDTTYTANITGLTSGQTYYVKVEAVGPGGTSDAKTGSFVAGAYSITEKFVDLSGNPVDPIGLPNNTVYVAGSYTASGIPASHTVGSDTYEYIGYKLDSYTSGDALTSGMPSSVTITGSRDVYYVYSNFADLTISKTVTGAYADLTKAFTFTVYFQDGSGNPLAGGTQFTYTGGASPSGGTLTLDGDGKATFTLSHGQTITIAGVSTSGRVRIAETIDPNYTPSFKDSLDAAPTSGSDTGGRPMTAADRTFDFTNARNAVVPAGASTGSSAFIWLLIMAFLATMASLAIKAACRRRAGRS